MFKRRNNYLFILSVIVINLISFTVYSQNKPDLIWIKTKYYQLQYPSYWTIHTDHSKEQAVTQLGRLFRDYYTTPITSNDITIASFSIDVFRYDLEFYEEQVKSFGSESDTRKVIQNIEYKNPSLAGKYFQAESMVYSPEKDQNVQYFVDTWILSGKKFIFRLYFSTSDPGLYKDHQLEAQHMVDTLREL
jgi:hypothetical protein